MTNPLIKALKRVFDEGDDFDIFLFIVLLCIFPPLTIAWLVVRVVQEWK